MARAGGPRRPPGRGAPQAPHPGLRLQAIGGQRRATLGLGPGEFGTPEAFFERFFVWNYCPLVFLEESGKNRTPDKLPKAERTPLFEACDLAFRQMVECLAPRRIIGVGKFATDRARAILGESGPPISTVLHPSPASPIANRGWAPQAERQLEEMGIQLP